MMERSPHALVNSIRMKRVRHKGVFIVVEGDSDARFYKMFVNNEHCRVVPAFSKESVLKMVTTLEQDLDGIVGIVDADFWRVDHIVSPSPNVIMTDCHDLESMILSSSALAKVLAEYGDDDRIEQFERRVKKSILDTLIDAGYILGGCRWFSLNQHLNIRFSHLNFEHFVEPQTLKINRDQLLKSLRLNSSVGAPVGAIRKYLNHLKVELENAWQMSCGHDLVSVLLMGLKFTFGSQNADKLGRASLESDLRLAYSEENFRKTAVYQSLKNWEQEHKPFTVFE
ncbi:MAG: DUF4435 domain-containing protein [SAR324 cluster bacterium]|nr:DUF4435 domain-containing protein [SAR324 cluster bacterium]